MDATLPAWVIQPNTGRETAADPMTMRTALAPLAKSEGLSTTDTSGCHLRGDKDRRTHSSTAARRGRGVWTFAVHMHRFEPPRAPNLGVRTLFFAAGPHPPPPRITTHSTTSGQSPTPA